MKALIPAAGKGTRLKPFTDAIPKELLPVGDKPIIERVVDSFKEAGVHDIVVVTGEGKHAILDYLGSGERLGVNMSYVYQDSKEGLGHAVLSSEHLLGGETFAVVNGDNYFYPLSFLSRLVKCHRDNDAAATIGVHEAEDVTRHGVIKSDGEVITEIVEKPSSEEAPSDLATLGAYVFDPVILDAIRETPCGIDNEIQLTDAIDTLIERGEKVIAEKCSGGHIDVGTPRDLKRANKHIYTKE